MKRAGVPNDPLSGQAGGPLNFVDVEGGARVDRGNPVPEEQVCVRARSKRL
jgi:hypothetical protein